MHLILIDIYFIYIIYIGDSSIIRYRHPKDQPLIHIISDSETKKRLTLFQWTSS